MSGVPQEKLLDRHTPKVANAEFLEFVGRLFTDAIDRSTHIFARCWATVPDTLLGQVPLFLHRHVLEMVDSIHIQILESASAPARPQLRSMFEAVCYLEYMTEEDEELRTKAYIVGSYLWGLQSARRMQKGSGERKVFLRELQTESLNDPEIGRKLITRKADVDKYEEFLASDLLAPAYELFLQFKKDRKRWPSTWYQVIEPGLDSLKDLALRLDRGGEYLRYDLWSRSVHPDLIAVHTIRPPDEDQQRVRKLRDGDRITATIDAAISGLRDANEYALRFARPEELVSFKRDWKEIERQLSEIGEEVTIWHPDEY